MELLTKMVADAANKAENDKLNVLGIFHTIFTESVPAAHAHLALALEFEAQPYEKGQTFDIKITLHDPDHKLLFAMEGKIEINKDAPVLKPIVPIAFNINNVVFPKFGNYRFEISVNGKKKGEIPLDVQMMTPPTGDNPL